MVKFSTLHQDEFIFTYLNLKKNIYIYIYVVYIWGGRKICIAKQTKKKLSSIIYIIILLGEGVEIMGLDAI